MIHVPEPGAAPHDGCAGELAESAATSAERVAAAEAIRGALMAAAGPMEAILIASPSMHSWGGRGVCATDTIADLNSTGDITRVVPRWSFPLVGAPDEMPDQMRLW